MKPPIKQLKADGLLLFVAFIWGTTFVIVQNAISFLPPFSFNAVRFFMAGLSMLLFIPFIRRHPTSHVRKMVVAGILMGFFLYIGYGFQTIGLVYTTSSKAAFITGLSVVLVPLSAWIFLRQRMSGKVWIASFFSICGLYLLTMAGSGTFNPGDLFVLICAFGFAFHIIATGQFSLKYDALLLTITQIFTVAFLSAATAFFMEDWQRAFHPDYIFKADVLLALGVTSLLATALAFFIQTKVQTFTSPTRVAILFAFEPVFAAMTAFVVERETLHFAGMIGCSLIFLSMILAELPVKKLKRSQKNTA